MKEIDLCVGHTVGHVVLYDDSQSSFVRVTIPKFLYLMPGIFDNPGVLLMALIHFSCQVRK